MAVREWLSKDRCIYRTPTGWVYARVTIPGMGRKEIALGKRIESPLADIDPKTVRSLVLLKDREVAALLKKEEPKPKLLWRFEDLAIELVEQKKTKAAKTLASAKLTFEKHLIPYANDCAPYLSTWDEKGETLWQQYIEMKRAITPDVKFLNHRKHLNMLLLRAFERRIIDRKITLYNPDPEINTGRVVTNEEVKALYGAAGPTLRVQILMAFTMGFRKSEILKLEWKRVDFERNEIILLKQHTKTRRARVVPMNPFVKDALLARKKKSKGLAVFPARGLPDIPQRSNRSAWRTAKRITLVKCRFHDLRHSFVTNAVRAGINPLLIGQYAGVK